MITLCDYATEPLSDGTFRHTCRRCGTVMISSTENRSTKCTGVLRPTVNTASPVIQPVRAGQCGHLGPQTRLETCPSCGGQKTQIKVFACQVHRECTLGKQLDGLHCCQGCHDFVAAAAQA